MVERASSSMPALGVPGQRQRVLLLGVCDARQCLQDQPACTPQRLPQACTTIARPCLADKQVELPGWSMCQAVKALMMSYPWALSMLSWCRTPLHQDGGESLHDRVHPVHRENVWRHAEA